MKKFIFFVSIIMAAARLQAQQEHHYTQFMYNKLLLNPAYAGARGVPAITAIYRNQWLGFEGSPQSALVSFHSPFLSNRFGAGVTVSHQKAGLNRDFFGNLAFSYDLIAQNDVSVRMGVMGSIRSLSIDFTKATPLVNGDNSLENVRVNEIFGNVGAGIYATFAGQFFAGFSVPRIYSNTVGFNPNQPVMIAKEYQHFYGSAGIIIPLSDDINLMPSALLKYVKNAPFDADINLSLDVRKKFTAGISYRIGGDGPGESVDLLAYWQATPQVAVGVAYDFTLSQIKDYTAGSIELLVQSDLKKRKRNMSNPRFFL
jgi:type IX secretion system PorP/SprF family membrane protein